MSSASGSAAYLGYFDARGGCHRLEAERLALEDVAHRPRRRLDKIRGEVAFVSFWSHAFDAVDACGCPTTATETAARLDVANVEHQPRLHIRVHDAHRFDEDRQRNYGSGVGNLGTEDSRKFGTLYKFKYLRT